MWPLTKTEQNILFHLVEGRTTNELKNEILFVSQNTIKTHLKSLFSKTGTNSQARLRAVGRSLMFTEIMAWPQPHHFQVCLAILSFFGTYLRLSGLSNIYEVNVQQIEPTICLLIKTEYGKNKMVEETFIKYLEVIREFEEHKIDNRFSPEQLTSYELNQAQKRLNYQNLLDFNPDSSDTIYDVIVNALENAKTHGVAIALARRKLQ